MCSGLGPSFLRAPCLAGPGWVLGQDASPGRRNEGHSARGGQGSARTGKEEGAASNDGADHPHAAGAEGALGKGAESPRRPCHGTFSH